MNTTTANLTINEARRQANSYAKALQMTKDGYRIQQYARTPVYAIFKPGSAETRNAFANYTVNLTPGKISCDCADFEKHGKCCKHSLYAEMEQKRQRDEAEEEARFEAMWQRWEEEQEDAQFVEECAIEHRIRF